MTDHAAAVEAVRARHGAFDLDYAMLDPWGSVRLLEADRATLLRAYEAVVEDRDAYQRTIAQQDACIATLRAQHAALVDTNNELSMEISSLLSERRNRKGP